MNSFEILSKVIELSNAPVDADRRLMRLVDMIAKGFSIPFCALFYWEPQQHRLSLKFCNQKHEALPRELSFSAPAGPLRTCILQRVPIVITDGSQLSLLEPPLPPHLAPFKFLAAFPVGDDIFLYGVLALLAETPRELPEEERNLLTVICRQLAGTLRHAQIALQAKKRIAELSTLHAIGVAVSSVVELPEVLNRITLSCTKILQAGGCILHFLDEERSVLKMVSSFGFEEGTGLLEPIALGEQVAGTVALKGAPLLVPNVQQSPFALRGYPPNISSVVCVPLVFQSKTIGTLTLFSIQGEGAPSKVFDEEDKNLLVTVASQVAIAIENAIILQRTELLAKDKEAAARELFLLYEISQAMLTTIQSDQLLRIILISVTLGNPKGFDRAILFLIDEKEKILKGMMGIGPSTREQADLWRQKLASYPPLSPDWQIPPEMLIATYDSRVQQMRVPFTEKRSILLKTIHERRPFCIENAADDPEVNPNFLRWFGGSRAFATVPLIAQDKAIGVIAVDNHLTGRSITPADLGFLTLLANQAALAIEKSRLYGNLQEINSQLLLTQNRLIQSEKLAALGEVVASITHEIKNPLVSIGGFARRLDRNLQENSPEKKYMRIVLKEVKRLEHILNETLSFSREPAAPMNHQDVNRIIEETLSILEGELTERGIAVRKKLSLALPLLLSDPQQIKQIFLNLFLNASQAIGQKGVLSVKTSKVKQPYGKFIQIEVTDTGGGIHQENLDNIFNPFFTTKQNGTGLGLAITHKIIRQYGGDIEVINRPGVGATFLVRFPIAESKPSRSRKTGKKPSLH
jgi:two-component system sensor histidine kinase HydH